MKELFLPQALAAPFGAVLGAVPPGFSPRGGAEGTSAAPHGAAGPSLTFLIFDSFIWAEIEKSQQEISAAGADWET